MDTIKEEKASVGCEILVHRCAKIKANDRALILYDEQTQDIAELMRDVTINKCPETRMMPVHGIRIHGQEPPKEIIRAMLWSTVTFCMTSYSLAQTEARRKAAIEGVKFLSLPQYDKSILENPALDVDYESHTKIADLIADCFSNGSEAELVSTSGTMLKMKIDGREGNSCPGWCREPGSLASPPDIETNIAPNELHTNGTAVINGSIAIPEIGLLKEPITLQISNGKIVDFGKPDSLNLKSLFSKFGDDARIVGELGVGLNPKAKLTGNMLIDEGALGTVHLGFGSNSSIGGVNHAKSHIDMILTDVDLFVDKKPLLQGGRIVLGESK